MIRDKEMASTVSSVMLDITARLNHSLAGVQSQCSAEEFSEYRERVARIMGEILDVLNPIYREHPCIKPDEFYLPPSSHSG